MISQILSIPESQMNLLNSLLVDGAMGRAGSIVLQTSGVDVSSSLCYIKVLPLSDDSNSFTHLLVVLFDIPDEVDTVNRRLLTDQSVTAH